MQWRLGYGLIVYKSRIGTESLLLKFKNWPTNLSIFVCLNSVSNIYGPLKFHKMFKFAELIYLGLYISTHSREKYWGTGAIEAISEQIRKEMPGLRGFSAENMKKMRTFSEFWSQFINRSPMATDLQKTEDECVIETDLFSLQHLFGPVR